MEVYASGAWRTITGAEAYVGGQWRTILSAEVYKGGAWRTVGSFIQPLTLSISPASISKGGSGPIVTYSSAVATPSGGSGPYTYLWEVTSGGPFSFGSATSGTTTVSADVSVSDKTGTIRCTVTDSLGATANSSISVSIFFRDTGGGGATMTL